MIDDVVSDKMVAEVDVSGSMVVDGILGDLHRTLVVGEQGERWFDSSDFFQDICGP